jgi:hypothetical protein
MSRPEARNLISIDILYSFIVEFILPEMLFPFIPSLLPLEGVAIRSRVVPSQPLFFLRVPACCFYPSCTINQTATGSAERILFGWLYFSYHVMRNSLIIFGRDRFLATLLHLNEQKKILSK